MELALTMLLVRFFAPETQLYHWQIPLIGAVWAAYAVCGLVMGGVGGVWLIAAHREPFTHSASYRTMATLTLALAFSVNTALGMSKADVDHNAVIVALIMRVGLACFLVWSLWRRKWPFLASAWIVSLLHLLGPWISNEAYANRSMGFKIVMTLALTLAAASAVVFYRRALPNRMGWLRDQMAAVTVAVVIAVIVVLFTNRTARAVPLTPDLTAGKPNVLLITMDTVRADHLSIYGYRRATTPNLERFAAGATVYNRAFAAGSFTLPAHASIFTGVYPDWHGAHPTTDFPQGHPLGPDYATLAEVLHSQGYWTGAIIANMGYLTPVFGLDRGFDVYDSRKPVPLFQGRHVYLRDGAWRILRRLFDMNGFEAGSRRSGDVNQRALELLNTRNHKPFFLFLNYMDAHAPYVPPEPFDRLFPGRDQQFIFEEKFQKLRSDVNAGERSLQPAERLHLISQYDGGIAYMDSEIGKLLAHLRDAGLYDNTTIIITADHGEAFGGHHQMEHGIGSVYNTQLHVPLIVKFAGQREGGRSEELVSQVDLMPTVLAAAHQAAPPVLQGKSLLSPGNSPARAIYSRAIAIGDQTALSPKLRGTRNAIIEGSMKLITWSNGLPELYDLDRDVDEQHNLYSEDGRRAKALLARISTWFDSMPKRAPRPDAPRPSEATLNRLRSLGYVQ